MYQAKDRAVPIRVPSVAQLCIDSADRINPISTTASSTVIQKGQSIIPGFFNRVALTEWVFDWNTPNVSGTTGGLSNDTFTYSVGGGPKTAYTIPTGFYTVAQLLDAIVLVLNGSPLGGVSWTVALKNTATQQGCYLTPSANNTFTFEGKIMTQLNIAISSPFPISTAGGWLVIYPDIRPCVYLDLECPQLTYTQNVKDNSSQTISRDTLARWYFAYDQPPTIDKYNFPILMGYSQFILRRVFNPAKQIQWETNLPITGSLNFTLYNENGTVMPLLSYGTNFLITLQVSED